MGTVIQKKGREVRESRWKGEGSHATLSGAQCREKGLIRWVGYSQVGRAVKAGGGKGREGS